MMVAHGRNISMWGGIGFVLCLLVVCILFSSVIKQGMVT